MRNHLLGRLVEATEPLELDAPSLVREAFGPKTAAWLVNRHRKQLHRTGAVDFVIKETVWKRLSIPNGRLYWLFLALEYLKRRQGWSVVQSGHRGALKWRVRWHGWLEQARKRRPTTADIQRAASKLAENNIPPATCSGCGAKCYVVLTESTRDVVKIVLCETCTKK